VNFFSFNIQGERSLVADMMKRIHSSSRIEGSAAVSEYVHHLIHEENAHSYMLSRYCYAYADGVMPEPKLPVAESRLSALGTELLFYGRVYVLETFLAFLNTKTMQDDMVDDVTRQVNELHHLDEARHIAWDRINVHVYMDALKERGAFDELDVVCDKLDAYRRYALSRLCNPAVYEAAGLPEPLAIYRRVMRCAQRASLGREWTSRADDLLKQMKER